MVNLSGRMEAFMSVNLVKINETDEANIQIKMVTSNVFNFCMEKLLNKLNKNNLKM